MPSQVGPTPQPRHIRPAAQRPGAHQEAGAGHAVVREVIRRSPAPPRCPRARRRHRARATRPPPHRHLGRHPRGSPVRRSSPRPPYNRPPHRRPARRRRARRIAPRANVGTRARATARRVHVDGHARVARRDRRASVGDQERVRPSIGVDHHTVGLAQAGEVDEPVVGPPEQRAHGDPVRSSKNELLDVTV